MVAAALLEGLQALTPDRHANLVAAGCAAGGVLAGADAPEIRGDDRDAVIRRYRPDAVQDNDRVLMTPSPIANRNQLKALSL